ncbi:PAS domain S-box protein [Microcoleus sp. FACHB-SPT15]|uniref:adenylate/guanylate cyclase domain-containing protein n=1 Tax=Microcoleus sp. FACHB-SPT15 TaxID=2692830 RepID=UPI001781CEB3|nr:adenylate/guanylate cyclase domain-containing protein [Microcoleus sp. FACHB-SPT15]MBD1804286.1 PAS domain S-box protein [Microcoleus sp. FACHB-SPT15]
MNPSCEESKPNLVSREASLQAFFNLSPDLLCIRGSDGFFKELNSVWISTLGWTLDELRSRPWLDFVHPDDVAFTFDVERQCQTEGANYTPIQLKNRYRCRDGSYRWLSWRLSAYENGLSYGIAQDVSQSNWRGSGTYRTEVQETVKLRDQALTASSVGIVIADTRLPDMPLIYVNPAFEQITGYSATEVLGYNCRFLQGTKTSQPAVAELRDAIKAGKHCTVTLLNYRKDGTPFWNELTISPIHDDDDNLTHFVGIQADISDRIKAEQALRLEKNKSERLLLNILPKPIVEQLKRFEGSLAQQYTEATILFADLVDFTPLCAQMPPLELLNLLNQIFSVFDQLAEKHGVEKIKTIGDAYMVAGGLPVPIDNHAEAIAQMALDMQQAIHQFKTQQGESFQIRIGINTGPVVAGVIGIKKFSYDLWGDAVNVASRMESYGIPGRIQVTAATKERLQDKYLFEERGAISVKGKGKMITYWLVGKK